MDYIQEFGNNPEVTLLGLVLVIISGIVLLAIAWAWNAQSHDRWEKSVVKDYQEAMSKRIEKLEKDKREANSRIATLETKLAEVEAKQQEETRRADLAEAALANALERITELSSVAEERDGLRQTVNDLTTRLMVAEAVTETLKKKAAQPITVYITPEIVLPEPPDDPKPPLQLTPSTDENQSKEQIA
jgi:Flp pilus assembly protein TadB